ncbi:hypothetical protein [Novipirellula artificiosorum]|uniref:Uncharacterized protein n=1 Tax=Novipirellula artificiosorum TaxID=2528016 RepID=A0A5C6DVG1_9BACT|nr:hypothetical protein [Novipirellula artificiosorum]TWU40598.1 hypothetical protein Poly41_14310 [Novipirellula artificiosorum]
MASRHNNERESKPLGRDADQTEMTDDLLHQAIVHASSQAAEPASAVPVAASPIGCGSVLGFSGDGDVMVQIETPSNAAPIACDVLIPAGGIQMQLDVGDRVLVHAPLDPNTRGCILGRVGRYQPSRVVGPRQPDHVVIEADEQLSLRCGDASIEMRKDGKLMIRGIDVLSKAKRTQRIKGGNVAIN